MNESELGALWRGKGIKIKVRSPLRIYNGRRAHSSAGRILISMSVSSLITQTHRWADSADAVP